MKTAEARIRSAGDMIFIDVDDFRFEYQRSCLNDEMIRPDDRCIESTGIYKGSMTMMSKTIFNKTESEQDAGHQDLTRSVSESP